MAYSDEYRDLIVDVSDAIEVLLKASSVDSWIGLRTEFGHIRNVLDQDDRERTVVYEHAAAREPASDLTRGDPRWQAWYRTSDCERVQLILSALNDEQLPIGELAGRVESELAAVSGVCNAYVSSCRLQAVLYKMLDRGEIRRVKRMGSRRGVEVWHYSRVADLDGPIADLERTYNDD